MTPPTTDCGGGMAWSPANVQTCFEFSARDHRHVQLQIERRANQLWQANGRTGNALNHWLEAEAQVITEFLANRPAATGRTPTHTGCTLVPSWSICQFEPRLTINSVTNRAQPSPRNTHPEAP